MRCRAELILHRSLVQLHHDPIDLVLNRMSVLAEVLDSFPDLSQVPSQSAMRADRQSPTIHRVVGVGEPIGVEAFEDTNPVADKAQIP